MNEILIYDDIGASWFDEGVTAKGVKSQLDEMTGDITVRINSGGGDVFEGFAIYELLKEHDGNVTVKVDGLAASAASVIAMAGNNVFMGDTSLMMIHDPWTFTVGNSADLTKTAGLLDIIKGSIVSAYKNKIDSSDEQINTWMSDETWFNAQDAIKHGFADEKEEIEGQAMNFVKPWIQNAPMKPEKQAEDTVDAKELYKVSLLKKKMSLLDI